MELYNTTKNKDAQLTKLWELIPDNIKVRKMKDFENEIYDTKAQLIDVANDYEKMLAPKVWSTLRHENPDLFLEPFPTKHDVLNRFVYVHRKTRQALIDAIDTNETLGDVLDKVNNKMIDNRIKSEIPLSLLETRVSDMYKSPLSTRPFGYELNSDGAILESSFPDFVLNYVANSMPVDDDSNFIVKRPQDYYWGRDQPSTSGYRELDPTDVEPDTTLFPDEDEDIAAAAEAVVADIQEAGEDDPLVSISPPPQFADDPLTNEPPVDMPSVAYLPSILSKKEKSVRFAPSTLAEAESVIGDLIESSQKKRSSFKTRRLPAAPRSASTSKKSAPPVSSFFVQPPPPSQRVAVPDKIRYYIPRVQPPASAFFPEPISVRNPSIQEQRSAALRLSDMRRLRRSGLKKTARMSNGDVNRLMRRAGVLRSSNMTQTANTLLVEKLRELVGDAVLYTTYANRNTVTPNDVNMALKRNGMILYL